MSALRCYRCGRPLTERNTIWLELSSRTGRWTTSSAPWPENESQGSFSFGQDCAPRQLVKPRDAHPDWYKIEVTT